MRITSLNLKKMPDGTKLKVFLSGGKWADGLNNDFGIVKDVVKFGDKLYEFGDYFDIKDMDKKDGYEFEVAINEYDDKNFVFLSNSESTSEHGSCIDCARRSSLV